MDIHKEGLISGRYNNSLVTDLRSNLVSFDKDSRKETRLHHHECKTCFYIKNPKFGEP